MPTNFKKAKFVFLASKRPNLATLAKISKINLPTRPDHLADLLPGQNSQAINIPLPAQKFETNIFF